MRFVTDSVPIVNFPTSKAPSSRQVSKNKAPANNTAMSRRPTRTLTDEDSDHAIVSLPNRTMSSEPTLSTTETNNVPSHLVGQQSLFRDFWGSFTSQSTTSHQRNVKKREKEGSTPGVTESSATPNSDKVGAVCNTPEISDVEAPPISSKPEHVVSSSAGGAQISQPGAVRAGGLAQQAQGGISPQRMASIASSDGDYYGSSRHYNNDNNNVKQESEILVDASLVEESEQQDSTSVSLVDQPILIADAKHMEDPTVCNTFLSNRRLKCSLLVMALGLVGAAVAITQAIGQGGGVESNNTMLSVTTLAPITVPTLAPSSMPSEQGDLNLDFFVRHILPNQTQVELNDPESAPFQALTWLKDNANLETYNTERRLQRFVLATFYFATRGPTWWINSTNWISDAHECDWYHSTVLSFGNETFPTICTEDGFYQVLALEGNRMLGTLAPELGLLTRLVSIHVWDNSLSGEFPTQLTGLSALTHLELNDNFFSGTIPNEISHMTQLEQLDLTNNLFRFKIPSALTTLTNLRTLYLEANFFSDSIPSELSRLEKLEILAVTQNMLSGTIPSELSALTRLVDLFLNENLLFGTIPSELGLCTQLRFLNLGNNTLSGSIPEQLWDLTNLQLLDLFDNSFNGSISSNVGRLTNTENLYFEHNQLTGTIPTEVGVLVDLQLFWAHANDLTGSLPTELSLLIQLEELSLHENMLKGSIPGELANLGDLTVLALEDNDFTGDFPSEICQLQNLSQSGLSVDCEEVNCNCCYCGTTN